MTKRHSRTAKMYYTTRIKRIWNWTLDFYRNVSLCYISLKFEEEIVQIRQKLILFYTSVTRYTSVATLHEMYSAHGIQNSQAICKQNKTMSHSGNLKIFFIFKQKSLFFDSDMWHGRMEGCIRTCITVVIEIIYLWYADGLIKFLNRFFDWIFVHKSWVVIKSNGRKSLDSQF